VLAVVLGVLAFAVGTFVLVLHGESLIDWRDGVKNAATLLQLQSLRFSIGVTWPRGLVALFNVIKLAAIDFKATSPECYLGSAAVRGKQFISNFSMIPAGCLLFFLVGSRVGLMLTDPFSLQLRDLPPDDPAWQRPATVKYLKFAKLFAKLFRVMMTLGNLLIIPVTGTSGIGPCETYVDDVGASFAVPTGCDEEIGGGVQIWPSIGLMLALIGFHHGKWSDTVAKMGSESRKVYSLTLFTKFVFLMISVHFEEKAPAVLMACLGIWFALVDLAMATYVYKKFLTRVPGTLFRKPHVADLPFAQAKVAVLVQILSSVIGLNVALGAEVEDDGWVGVFVLGTATFVGVAVQFPVFAVADPKNSRKVVPAWSE
jgi:hypothetical protein